MSFEELSMRDSDGNPSYDYGFMSGMQSVYDNLVKTPATAAFHPNEDIRDSLAELDDPFSVSYYEESGDLSVGIPDIACFTVTPNPEKVVVLTRAEADRIDAFLNDAIAYLFRLCGDDTFTSEIVELQKILRE
jgi:hypothetical protein